MPYSDRRFDSYIENFIREKTPTTVLDVGAGAGKYAELIKPIIPEVYLEAIEPDLDYHNRFKLNEKYNFVHGAKIEDFINTIHGSDRKWDLIIFGDVIEHLKKSDGIDVLNNLVYRAKWIIVIFPYNFVQYNWQDEDGKLHELENHISVWGEIDFKNFDYKYLENDIMKLVIIKGFI